MTEPPTPRSDYDAHGADWSIGDVIHAEPDGTMVLDDGITTWNPQRACEFLLAEQRRILVAHIQDEFEGEREVLATSDAYDPMVTRDARVALGAARRVLALLEKPDV